MQGKIIPQPGCLSGAPEAAVRTRRRVQVFLKRRKLKPGARKAWLGWAERLPVISGFQFAVGEKG